MVDIWTYQDSILQSTQLLSGTIYVAEMEATAVINIAEKTIHCIAHEDERLLAYSSPNNDFVVVSNKKNFYDNWWKTYEQKTSYLVSLKDGTRKLLDRNNNTTDYSFSPGGKYLIYYNTQEQDYFSYHLTSGEIYNISQTITAPLGNRRLSR